jgi:hypothetical protein
MKSAPRPDLASGLSFGTQPLIVGRYNCWDEIGGFWGSSSDRSTSPLFRMCRPDRDKRWERQPSKILPTRHVKNIVRNELLTFCRSPGMFVKAPR